MLRYFTYRYDRSIAFDFIGEVVKACPKSDYAKVVIKAGKYRGQPIYVTSRNLTSTDNVGIEFPEETKVLTILFFINTENKLIYLLETYF